MERASCDATEAIIDQRRDNRDVAWNCSQLVAIPINPQSYANWFKRTCTGKPGTHSESLFIFFVPTTNYKHKHWANTRLDETEEESLRIERLECMTCGAAHDDNPPDEGDTRSNTLNWPSLGHHHGWIGAYNKTKVEDSRGEDKAIADVETQVLSQSEKCLNKY